MCFVVEVWKTIPGHERYEVSSLGRVRRGSRLLTPDKAGKSMQYLKYRLSKKNRMHNMLEHRLVALAFLDNPHDKPTVNHLEADRKDFNFVTNLAWATHAEQAEWKQKLAGVTVMHDGDGYARDEAGWYI